MQREERRYDEIVNGIVNDIADRIYRYEMILQGGAGVFAASEEVTREEWQAYCEYQQTVELYPGVQGIGFVKIVKPAELKQHVEEIRAEGFPDYMVWPDGERDLHAAVIYLEPFDQKNRRAFGYDMYTEPVRRTAMERAQDAGTAAISGRVNLIQETDESVQPGFLMYVPVYAKNLPHSTLEERKVAIEGFVYALFRMNDLLLNIFPDPVNFVNFAIYDGSEVAPDRLLYDSINDAENHQPFFASRKNVDFYGHEWTIVFHSTPSFETTVSGLFTPKGILVIVASLLLSFVIFFYLRMLDITGTHVQKMNFALQESEQKYRYLTENIVDVIWTADLEGNLTYCSPASEKMIGYTPEELMELPMNTLIVQEDYDALMHKLMEELVKPPEERDQTATLSVRYRSKDKRLVYTELNVSWIVDEKDNVIGINGSSRDVTERKMAEEEIRKLNEELEQRVIERTKELEAVNKELESFAYSISHDFRAPLRALNAYSAVLIEKYNEQLGEQGLHYLNRINKASLYMSDLVDDLLSLSRITRAEVKKQAVDLSHVAEEIIKDLKHAEPERPVTVAVESGLSARGDFSLLKDALENLLENAWKFSSLEPQAKIEVGQTVFNGEKVFFVRDNGVGFNMAYADKLFGAFQRLHGAEEFPGTGIGLATVQRIINRHGGRIWVESEVGKGATFYFTLPKENKAGKDRLI